MWEIFLSLRVEMEGDIWFLFIGVVVKISHGGGRE